MYHCDICNDEGFTYHYDDEGRFIAVPCTCREIRNQSYLFWKCHNNPDIQLQRHEARNRTIRKR